MLASLLPGVREIRASLIAGYLWLFTLWLILAPSLPDRQDATGVIRSVLDLANAAPPAMVALAGSLIAYLVGTVIVGPQVLRDRIGRLDERNPVSETIILAAENHKLLPTPSSYARLELERLARQRVRQAESKMPPDSLLALAENFFAYADPRHRWQSVDPQLDRSRLDELPTAKLRQHLIDTLAHEAAKELSRVATRLIGDQSELFSTVDRLRAESELRLAVVFPLFAILGTVAARATPYSLFAIPVVAILARHGFQRERDADHLLVDAIAVGKVEAPAFDRLRSAMDETLDASKRASTDAAP